MVKRRAIVIACAAVALGLVCGLVRCRSRRGPALTLPDPGAERYQVPVGDAPSRGPRDAAVTIVEWSDFQCPVSARVEATLHELMDAYGDDVRLVWKNRPLPFHARAMPAAEIAMAAWAKQGSSAFWRLHDRLFENQVRVDRPALEDLARQAGLSEDDIRRALDDRVHDDRIRRDADEAQRLGARGWPVFFVNGRPLSGMQPREVFEKIIDEERANAARAIRLGARPDEVYDVVTRGAKLAAYRPSLPGPRARQDAPASHHVDTPATAHERSPQTGPR